MMPEQDLERYEYWANIFRQEQQWEKLYIALSHLTMILRWFPTIVPDRDDKIKRYKEELKKVESKIFEKILQDPNLMGLMMTNLREELRDLYESDATREEIQMHLQKFFAMGEGLPESVNDASYVVEDVDTALQLWKAHLCAAQCFAILHCSGLYRPPFSVVTCRIPEWVVELWSTFTEQQRLIAVDRLLQIEEMSRQLEQCVALEDWNSWLDEVRKWLLERGQRETAARITQLMQQVDSRQLQNTQEGCGQMHWLLPHIQHPPNASKEVAD